MSYLSVIVLAGIVLQPLVALGVVVSSTAPGPNALNIPADISIVVTFDESIEPMSVDSAALIVRGNMSGLHPGSVAVSANQLTFDPYEDFAVGDLVLVVVKRDVKSTGGDSLTNGHCFYFTIASQGGTGELVRDSVYSGENIPYYIYGGDLDGDGDMDIATPNEGSQNVSIYFNNGDGSFGPLVDYPSGTLSSSVYGDDFDNDGDQDLAVANKISNDVSVLLNLGNGVFGSQTLYDAGTGTQQIYGGDFDNDGDIDIVTSQTGTNDLRFYFNDGIAGFDSTRTLTWPGADPNGIFGGDFNNDGYFDVATGNFGFGTLTIVFGAGDGTFAVGGSYPIGASTMMYGADFDADGFLDIIATRNFTDEATFAFNDGAGGFDIIMTKAAGDYPLAAWCGDLDGDGDADAMLSNFASGDLSLYFNLGGGVFTDQVLIPLAQSGSFVWFHDLDGDGDLDVSAVDELADSLYIFFNKNVSFDAAPRVGPAPLEVTFTPIAPAGTGWLWDFGDGDSAFAETPMHTYSAGLYDVGLTVTTPNGSASSVINQFVTALAESVMVSDTTAEPSVSIAWDIVLTNHVPVTEIILPIRMTKIPTLAVFDSISRVGTRTAEFQIQQVLFNNLFGGEMVIRLAIGTIGAPVPLESGIGPIARVHLTMAADAMPGSMIAMFVDSLAGHALGATTVTTSFRPEGDTAALIIAAPPCACICHADPVCDQVPDVFDVLGAVAVAFQNGDPVFDTECPRERTDVNCDGFTDVFDVLAFVSVAFQNGSTSQFCDACAP